MTERRGDQGFSVTPQRIGEPGGGPGRRRRRGLGLAVVVAAAAAIFAISWLGPRLSERPSFDVSFFATPTPDPIATPSPTATPAQPLGPPNATPLPEITRPDGPVPTGRIALETGDLRVIDLATGRVVAGPRAVAGRDVVFPTPGADGWTCVCFDDGELSGVDGRVLRIETIDPGGNVIQSPDVATFRRTPSETGRSDVTTDVEVFGAGRRGLLAVASRDDGPWRFLVGALDIAGRTMGPTVELGSATGPVAGPSASPAEGGIPQDLYLDGPHVRVSPDGRVAFVWGAIQQFAESRNPTTEIHAWRVALGADGSVGAITAARGLLDLPMFCGSVGFAAADRLAWLCPSVSTEPSTEFDGTWELGTVDLDGQPAGKNSIVATNPSSYFEAMFDRANGQMYTWDPSQLTISRYDAHTLVGVTNTFDPFVGSATGLAPGGGSAPVDWHHADSSVTGGYGTLTGSLDGGRLFALGFDPETAPDSGAQVSRGVFVIDRTTLALVDRWAPVTSYIALTALPDGYVAATGLPGVKEDGHFAPWEASVTIHDAADGRVLVRFGQLGSDGPPLVVGP